MITPILLARYEAGRSGVDEDARFLFVQDDGGRSASGYVGVAGDCVVRSIAIASETRYQVVYDALAQRMKDAGHARSARNGVHRKIIRAYLAELGWHWTPTMQIGSGCTVHLRADELPAGRLVVSLSKHITAVVDGVVHDTYDPSREGTRCVYGYWEQG